MQQEALRCRKVSLTLKKINILPYRSFYIATNDISYNSLPTTGGETGNTFESLAANNGGPACILLNEGGGTGAGIQDGIDTVPYSLSCCPVEF